MKQHTDRIFANPISPILFALLSVALLFGGIATTATAENAVLTEAQTCQGYEHKVEDLEDGVRGVTIVPDAGEVITDICYRGGADESGCDGYFVEESGLSLSEYEIIISEGQCDLSHYAWNDEPGPTNTTAPTDTPEPTITPDPTATPEGTPEDTETPDLTETSDPTATPEETPDGTETPDPTSTPGETVTVTPVSTVTETPESTITPGPENDTSGPGDGGTFNLWLAIAAISGMLALYSTHKVFLSR